MPAIKIQHLVSVSSEDKNHPAKNLLTDEGYQKWKCATGGLNKATVIFQFEKSSKISSIDIGNEGSAFIEVLVGRMTDDDDNYKVLLVASSFMGPLESRNWENINRVRLFNSEKLCKEIAEENWDRVKIVCTQPYNKTAQYGLSFVKFHSPSELTSNEIKKTSIIGSFTIREENDEPIHTPGSLFASKKGTQVSGALEVRKASQKEEKLLLNQNKSPILNAQPKQNNSIKITPKEKKTDSSLLPKKVQSVEKRKLSIESNSTEISSSKKARQKGDENVTAFNQLMSGVTFALSGFVNPLRSELREKAIAMGATYKPDWDKNNCTHLICAFANTPKFNQVKEMKGIIVTRDWILDSHKNKKRIAYNKYLMSGPDKIVDDNEKTKPKQVFQNDLSKISKEIGDKKKIETITTGNDSQPNSNDEDYGGSTDVDSDLPNDIYDSETEVDSDDDISSSSKKISGEKHSKSSYSENDDDSSTLPKLPDYFGGRVFFLYGDFEEKEKHKMLRYIVAFNGKESEYMNDEVDYVVTYSSWDNNFDEALNSNKNLVFVKPKWIFECGKKKKFVPYQPFIVSAAN